MVSELDMVKREQLEGKSHKIEALKRLVSGEVEVDEKSRVALVLGHVRDQQNDLAKTAE